MIRKLIIASFLTLMSFSALGREVPISSLPNLGKVPLTTAGEWAKKLTASLSRILPQKTLKGELLEAGFLPDNEMTFTFREIGINRTEEQETIKTLRELERAERGLVNKLLSDQATQRLCNQRDSWGNLMRSLLVSGIVVRYHMYIGDTAIGTATITKESRCRIK